MRISQKELNKLIREEVMNALGDDGFSLPDGRDISIVLKSIKSRIRLIDFSKIPPECSIASQQFKKLVANAEKYNDLFLKIRALVCGKIGNIEGLEFVSVNNNFQLSNDDEKIFLVIKRNFTDTGDEEGPSGFNEAIVSLGDNLDLISSEVNGKIGKFGMRVTAQYYKQGYVIVTLDTPFDFASYNNDLDKYMR